MLLILQGKSVLCGSSGYESTTREEGGVVEGEKGQKTGERGGSVKRAMPTKTKFTTVARLSYTILCNTISMLRPCFSSTPS